MGDNLNRVTVLIPEGWSSILTATTWHSQCHPLSGCRHHLSFISQGRYTEGRPYGHTEGHGAETIGAPRGRLRLEWTDEWREKKWPPMKAEGKEEEGSCGQGHTWDEGHPGCYLTEPMQEGVVADKLPEWEEWIRVCGDSMESVGKGEVAHSLNPPRVLLL